MIRKRCAPDYRYGISTSGGVNAQGTITGTVIPIYKVNRGTVPLIFPGPKQENINTNKTKPIGEPSID